jgi:PKD repeat protein
MKQILTFVRNLGLALILSASFSEDIRAQQPCTLNIAAQSDPNNSMSYTLNAYLTGDSICFGFNPVYTWTIYSNPGATLTGSQVNYTFTAPGIYGICVQANYQGMTSTKCDTLYVTQTGMNCTPTFMVSTQALNASFSLSGSVPSACFDGSTVYNWSFGDSTFATITGNTGTDHTYASPGTYNVCLTATALNGQTYTSCSSVTITNQGIFSLGGMVLSNSACLQDSVMVELYGIGNNHYDSFILNGGPDSCFYYFQTPLTAQPAQYIIRATPLNNPDFIPTYFGDVLFWGDATLIYPVENVWSLHINLLPNIYDTIPGIGTVSGSITGNGITVNSVFNGTPISTTFNVNACRVIILNSSNQPIGFGFVNADGSFSIGNLPAGNYFLRIDNPKVPSASIPFSIEAGSTNAVVNFAATGSGINVVTNTANRLNRASIEVWPNPASDLLFVKGLSGSVSILNAQGKEVIKTNAASEINISSLPFGIYQLSGSDSNGRMLNARFVKK